MSKVVKTLRHAFDIFLFFVLCFAEFALHRWFKPYHRGFFCDDDSLRYPYHQQTISVGVLFAIVLGIPALVILAVEFFKPVTNALTRDKPHEESSCCHLGKRLRRCYGQLGYFLFGLAMTVVASEIAKFSLGRLRPHFFSVCDPQLTDLTTCEDAQNRGRFIEEYTCRGNNATKFTISQLHQSFPSGHTSLSFYAMLYLALYLQMALSTSASKLLKHLLQFFFVMLAWYVALTRISDYWHHWSDVLAGMGLGVCFALLMAFFVADFFGRQRQILRVTSSSTGSSAQSGTPVLPAYTFGSVPYLPHHGHHHQVPHHLQTATYGQTYHNYGYVP